MITGAGGQRHLAVAIACHNRRATTLRCLDRLAAQAMPPDVKLHIVIVDDGSSDGTAEAIAAAHPQVRMIRADGSLYWAGAMARALDAIDGGPRPLLPDFVLWLNDDVDLLPDAVAQLIAVHDAAPGSIVVGWVADPVSGRLSYGAQRRTSSWHPLRLEPVQPDPSGQAQKADTFQGNCVLVPHAARLKLGGIEPAFSGIQGMADTDYGLRATAAGIAILQAPRQVGACAPNTAPPSWRRAGTTVAERLRAVIGPRAFPPRLWWLLMRRHAPLWLAPILFLLAPLKAAFAALLPPAPQDPPQVALIEGVAPAYRLGLYAGLARIPGMRFHIFDGAPLRDQTVDPAPEPLPLPATRGRNIYWPRWQGRIAWSNGIWTVLCGDFAVVVFGQHSHDLSLWLLWLARLLLGRPLLVAHGHFRLSGHGLAGWLRRLQLRGIDHAFCYSDSGAEACRALGFSPARLTVIGNSLDTEAMLARRQARLGQDAAIRQRLGVAAETDVLLFVGRLHPAKRLDLSIETVKALRAAGRDCLLVVIGDGPERRLLESTGHADVRVLGSVYDDEMLADWFSVACALLLPDGIGLSAVHALGHGVPVISLAAPQAAGPEFDYLRDGENALLAKPGGLSATAARLLDDPALRERLAAGAVQSAKSLSMEAMVSRYGDGLRRTLAGAA